MKRTLAVLSLLAGLLGAPLSAAAETVLAGEAGHAF